MFLATCRLIGVSDLMYGKHVADPKQDDETYNQHEQRTWKEKVHQADDGQLFIQPFALKNCLESAAKWLSLKIPGERSKTYTKRFVSGIMAADRLLLINSEGIAATMSDIDPVNLFVPSDGKRGSGTRVQKVFPTLHAWNTTVAVHVFDNKITENVFFRHMEAAGKFIGFGSMRAENGGINGRFQIDDIVWAEIEC